MFAGVGSQVKELELFLKMLDYSHYLAQTIYLEERYGPLMAMPNINTCLGKEGGKEGGKGGGHSFV